MTENRTIYAKLVDMNGGEGPIGKKEITNIDKTAPEIILSE